jgi:hypothetical protein
MNLSLTGPETIKLLQNSVEKLSSVVESEKAKYPSLLFALLPLVSSILGAIIGLLALFSTAFLLK